MSARDIEEGFSKAWGSDLPRVDLDRALDYVQRSGLYTSSEMAGVKASRSASSGYADDAIGYVNLKRTNEVCIVRARITPEHRVRQKGYRVQAKIREATGEVLSSKCYDCTASAGGCKHAIAFLFWLHRRSEEKTPTEVPCYWRKSNLAKVGTDVKFVLVKDLAKERKAPKESLPANVNFLNQLRDRVERDDLPSRMSALMHTQNTSNMCSVQIDLALDNYIASVSSADVPSADGYVEYLKAVQSGDWTTVPFFTVGQSTNPTWFKYRFGRVTGSRLYEAANSHTFEGSLRESLLCSRRFKGNAATKRGLLLEPQVIKVVERETELELNGNCGLYLRNDHPLLGASPDALSRDGTTAVEVKCPTSGETFLNYIRDGKINAKFRVQLQTAMMFTGAEKGLFVVADPEFESNNKITIVEDTFDRVFLDPFIDGAQEFWKRSIFCELLAHRSK